MMKSPLKYHGGKSYIAKKIVALMPPHKRYLEAFSGGLSVLLAKPYEGISEYANDLNDELSNFWRVLAQTPDRMLRALWGTPLSQSEWLAAQAAHQTDSVKRATAFFIKARMSRQGLGRDYCTPTSRTRRGMNENVSAWLSAVDGLPEIHERLRRVEIWCRPAVEAIQKLDSEDTLIYCDPPYLESTRKSGGEYGQYEMSLDQHIELLECLKNIKGKFLLSGYDSELYNSYGFERVEFSVPKHSSSSKKKEKKVEVVWKNH